MIFSFLVALLQLLMFPYRVMTHRPSRRLDCALLGHCYRHPLRRYQIFAGALICDQIVRLTATYLPVISDSRIWLQSTTIGARPSDAFKNMFGTSFLSSKASERKFLSFITVIQPSNGWVWVSASNQMVYPEH